MSCLIALASCSDIKSRHPDAANGSYLIDPDGPGRLAPFSVLCDMSDKGGVGVTVTGHDSEARTLVNGCDPSLEGKYSEHGSGRRGAPCFDGLCGYICHLEWRPGKK